MELPTAKIYSQTCNEEGCTNSLERGFVTLYAEGKDPLHICRDCDIKRQLAQFQKDKIITSSIMSLFWMDQSEWERGMDRAKERGQRGVSSDELNLDLDFMDYHYLKRFWKAAELLLVEFQKRHWMGPLCKQIYDASQGLSGDGDGFKVMALAMAGRALITIKGDGKGRYSDASVTLIAEDGNVCSNTGLQGICATREEAIGLLHALVYELPEMLVDNEVRIAGF